MMTSSASVCPSAAASSAVRGATGLTSASSRASTSASGVSRAIRWRLSGSTIIARAIIIVIYIVVSRETCPPGAEHRKRGAVAEKTLNLRGLKCPLPALRARKALTGLKAGDMLIAECTDPLTAIDIPNLLNQTGDRLESSAREGDVLVFRIRKR
jgi:tRNA 2-thiouridine synthesizing protein A